MYDRTRIARGAGTAIAVWALIGLLVVSTGVAFAVPLAGIGGFVVSANEVTADSMTLYPGSADTTNTSGYPQAVVELQNPGMDDLQLTKRINASLAPGLTGTARLTIQTTGPASGGAMLVKTSALNSSDATFTQFQVDETNSSDPATRFDMISQNSVTLQDPNLRVHYLATNQLSLSDLSLRVCYDPDQDRTWEYGNC